MSGPGSERRCGYCGAVFAAAILSATAYLTFAALQGDYGLFRLIQIEAREDELSAELARLEAERLVIANRVERLSAASLDLDLLDERARAVLGLGHPDEIVIP